MARNLTELGTAELQELVASLGEPSYRAGQLQRWLYRDFAESFAEMTDLPAQFRRRLEEETALRSVSILQETRSKDGTVKALFGLVDARSIESVLMPDLSRHKSRYTVCVSTQVGCPIRCPFCATGQQGFERNLTSAEIIDQILYFAGRLKHTAGENEEPAITNIVFMGMGEPLANYDPVLRAVRRLNGIVGLGARRIAISTSGLAPQIVRLGQEDLQVRLAISLHAADDATRNWLVPINQKYPLDDLIASCREYARHTGRRISFEYALFAGVNDTVRQARALAHLLRGIHSHVNLIQGNSLPGGLESASADAVTAFRRELDRLAVPCTLRQPRGLDIDSGCGQLRSRFISGGGRRRLPGSPARRSRADAQAN